MEGMRATEFISEVRKNPKLNPKVSINQAVIDRMNATSSTVAGTLNAFVSFTQLEKLGINPQSTYDTPIGIYAYPIKYVYEQIEHHKSADELPFAGGARFANLFSVRGNIINIGALNEAEL